jgi:asparagine synthase (glutamine-hydrolysing)
MCGICGVVYHPDTAAFDPARLPAMRDVMRHRGPDDSGGHTAPGVAFGTRRLAIVDLSANGHMPMRSPDGRYWISFNGESYNYRELRPMLEAKGHRFRSGTDTEVLLYLFMEEGPAMLHRLNGMFAFSIWDEQERRLLVARDRLGVKPLYYAEHAGALYFASEQKALFAAGVPAVFDPNTWEELLCFRYVAGERTPFQGVKRLLPGHYFTWQDGLIKIHRWWNLGQRVDEIRDSHATPKDAVGWFREMFDASVKLRTISDVPVGVLLSGGLDSSCVAASLGVQIGGGIASFTVRFPEKYYDEGPAAKVVADRWKLQFHELTVDPAELPDLVRHCTWLNDEPLAHANDPHLFAIAKFAKPLVTVLLSGEGADEALGGYVRYRPLRYLRSLSSIWPLFSSLVRFMPEGLSGSLLSRVQKLDRFLGMGSVDNFVLFDACDILPGELTQLGVEPNDDFLYRRQILTEAKAIYPANPMRQAMYLDQHTFLSSILDRNDRTTMGASIECRVPFLDYRLVEGLAAMDSSVLLAGHQSKILLRSAFADRIPMAVLRHRKWGFGVPWHRYFQTVPEFRTLIAELADSPPLRDGPFARGRIKGITDAYLRGDLRFHTLVRQLVFISIWHRECIGRARTGRS